MEEQKLLRKKRKADETGNKNALASACIDLAEMYVNQGNYEDAISEFEITGKIYKEMGQVLDYGRTCRGIGEAYVQLQEYDKALQYQQFYLDITKEQKNKLEEQRALATIGHIHLTRYLDNIHDSDYHILNLAYKAFKKSLVICESLTDVKKHEHKDMVARLLANLGVVEGCKGDYDKGIELLQKSIDICKSYDLFEQLFRSYTSLGALYDHKKMYHDAIQQCNLAFDVAGRLKDKTTLQCESLSLKGDLLIKLADFHSAKNVLLKAYKLKDLNSSYRESIRQNLKVVAAMCKAEDTLLTTGNGDFKTKKLLYEKLGDGACRLKNFPSAIDYYHKMLEAALATYESGLDLSPCYISLAETYRDNKQFDMAIKYFRDDYNISRSNPKDAITTLLRIADCMESGNCSSNDIQNTYKEALTISKATGNRQMEYKVLVKYIPVLKKYRNFEEAFVLEDRIKDIDHVAQESESEQSEDQATPNIGDDISINDLTDVSDCGSDSENRATRKRAKRFVIKKNNKGESQLHTACIKGNFELVKHLIEQGHTINVRDNCGWLPIHEACICGHVEIVSILIQNGALINDRGGTHCQGITPLHDAALNGHLEVIRLLLDNGASSIIKNDNGEIPLHTLKKWRESQHLNDNESILYDVLVKRLTQDADKLGVVLSTPASGDNSAIVTENSEELIKSTIKPRRKTQVGNLRRNVVADEDFGNRSKSTSETPAQSEYKRVMENLRHPPKDVGEKKRKSNDRTSSAHVSEDSDDWLEDDVGSSSKKRKTGTVDGFVNSTTMRRNRSGSSFGRHSSSSSLRSSATTTDEVDIPPDFFEPDFQTIDTDDGNSTGRASRLKKKRQTSLIDSGFTRRRSFSPTVSMCSSNSCSPIKGNCSSRIESIDRRSSGGTRLDMNSIFNTEPMLSVDVRISGKLYKVPVPASEIRIRTIKWLADEAAKRYSKKECMKPDLELETKNGANLADEDLISVLFSAGITHAEEVEARIIKCNVLPLSERYTEACASENIIPPKELLKVLEETSTTLNLSDLNLRSKNIIPLCKVISRQVNLNSLNLRGNFIHDKCFQLLCASLSMLDNLVELDLSLNRLTHVGLQYFSEMMVQSTKPPLSNLIKLDVSHNPLGNKSLSHLAVITRYVNLKTLKLVDVDFTSDFDANVDLVLDSVVNFDLSFNKLSNKEILISLSWLKPQVLETLNVSSNSETCEGLIKEVLQRFSPFTGTTIPLKSLNLSRTHATDSDVFYLLKILPAARQFKSLDLSYNSNITSLSLRRLFQTCPSFDHLNVIGCENIFKYFTVCSDNMWSCVRLKELQLSCDFGKCFVEKNHLVNTWKEVYKKRAVVFEVPNFVKLSLMD